MDITQNCHETRLGMDFRGFPTKCPQHFEVPGTQATSRPTQKANPGQLGNIRGNEMQRR